MKTRDKINNLEYENMVDEKSFTGYFSPSDADMCDLALYYKMLKIPGKSIISLSAKRKMDRGRDSEYRFLTYLEQTKDLVAKQVDLYLDSPPGHGKMDALILEDNEVKIIEHTTKDYFVFQKLKAPPENKVKQWQIYSGWSGIQHGYITVDGGLDYMAESSYSPPYKWFEMSFDCDIYSACMEKFLHILKCVETRTPPLYNEKLYYLGSRWCSSCAWFQQDHPDSWFVNENRKHM